MINIRSLNNYLPALCLLLLFAGCQRKLAYEGKIKPLEGDAFFADGSSARMPVKGTVPRGRIGTPAASGKELIDLGKRQYGIYCSICHGPRGAGDGMVVRRGFTRPRSFLLPELRNEPPTYYVLVMERGYKTMDTFRDLVDARGRFAVARYIKDVLQKEQ